MPDCAKNELHKNSRMEAADLLVKWSYSDSLEVIEMGDQERSKCETLKLNCICLFSLLHATCSIHFMHLNLRAANSGVHYSPVFFSLSIILVHKSKYLLSTQLSSTLTQYVSRNDRSSFTFIQNNIKTYSFFFCVLIFML
jgi:hypothetical protein